MPENGEFKGTTKEAIRNLRGDITEIKDNLKDFSNKNEDEHKQLFIAITEFKTEFKTRKLGWKAWSIIGAAFITSVGGIIVAIVGG